VDEGVEAGFSGEAFVDFDGAVIRVVETEGFAATEQGINDDGLFEFAGHVIFEGGKNRA